MTRHPSSIRLAFIIPTLSEAAIQDEDIIQLLLVASDRVDQALLLQPARAISVSIISIAPETAGWQHATELFSKQALEHIAVETVEQPATPNLAIASHKPAYDLFEYLKRREFDEVHCLDRYGSLYYSTNAKQLGLYFLNTVFVVHIVGGTLFRKEVADALVDDISALMDDLLERGSVERADVIYVHDRKAWQWYQDKIVPPAHDRVYDLAWPQKLPADAYASPADPDKPLALIYYGALGAEDGLPLFCDTISRALPAIKRPIEIYFIGAAQAVGGMDAVSYIHLRMAKWHVPVTIKRDLSIAEEVALLGELQGIVISNTVRRESLRARLIAGVGLPILHVDRAPGSRLAPDSGGYAAIPGQIAHGLCDLLAGVPGRSHRGMPNPTTLWHAGRSQPLSHADLPPAAPLELPVRDQPKVSVCITHFSRPHKLRTALATLKRQTYDNFEVIVVDDGSPDPAVQRELAKIQREIEPLGWRVVTQENRYLGAARNFGARHATGEYLLFMDDDNAAKPNEISTLVAVAQRCKAEIVTTFYDAFETDSDLDRPTPAMRFTPFGNDQTLGILTNCYGDANALYERKAFDRIGGFTEDYGITHEDWEFFCRASLEGARLVCVPEPLFWYRVDQNGMYRGEQTQLHKNANLRRHIRPFLELLPPYQARLVQLAQGLGTDLPLVTVGKPTRDAVPATLRDRHSQLPYARAAIITRTKDRPLLLRRAIQSALSQTFKDWLMVIVNDGGNPESVQLVVDSLADELAGRVLVVDHPISLGMQTAANAGISSCDSDFIIIHDDDDSWEPTFLARTVSHLDERGWNAQSGGVITWSRVIVEEMRDDGAITKHSDFIFNSSLFNLSLVELAIENRFPPISFLFRRAALEVVGTFREQHGVLGDWDFHLRMLQQFDIDVIPEPLANYHHRMKGTAGVYGNSVHVQTDIHRSKRIELINGVVRGRPGEESGLPLAQLLTLGELQHTLLAEQQREFQRLHDYMWMIEQRVMYISSRVEVMPGPDNIFSYAPYQGPAPTSGHRPPHNMLGAEKVSLHQAPAMGHRTPMLPANAGQNLVVNGDFRLWPDIQRVRRAPNNAFTYAEISPDVYVCYDGQHVLHRAERRKWLEDGEQLAFGQTFLHLENDGLTSSGSWFTLEYNIPSVALLAGKSICISGVARLRAAQSGIRVGGRYDLGNDRQLVWKSQQVALGTTFERWSCIFTCPSVQNSELQRGHRTRLLIQLPHDQHFEFDLTNFQIEFGGAPSDFQYRAFSRRQRAQLLWLKTKSWLKQSRNVLIASDESLNRKASAR